MTYPPETRARALLLLTAELISRSREPMPYGDLDLDGRRGRFLAAVIDVEAIADRRAGGPIGSRNLVLDRFCHHAGVDAADLATACEEVDALERAAMALAMAEILARSPVQAPMPRPPLLAIVPSPRDIERFTPKPGPPLFQDKGAAACRDLDPAAEAARYEHFQHEAGVSA